MNKLKAATNSLMEQNRARVAALSTEELSKAHLRAFEKWDSLPHGLMKDAAFDLLEMIKDERIKRKDSYERLY